MSSSHPTVPTIDILEAQARLEDPAAAPLVVDVREVPEFQMVRVEGVVLMPLSRFTEQFTALPKGRQLLVMCAAGSRSAAATAHLLRNGYTDVANVEGGIIAWQKAGLPVKRGPIEPGEGELPAREASG